MMKGLAQDDPPWIREGQDQDDEMDDEWFYASITRWDKGKVWNCDDGKANHLFSRYDHLCMYALSCRASSVAVSPDGGHLAVCGRVIPTSGAIGEGEGESRVNELMVLSLPDKLLSSSPRQEGLTAKRDVAFKAGARETAHLPFLQVGLQNCSKKRTVHRLFS